MTSSLSSRTQQLPLLAQAAGKILSDTKLRTVEKTKINALDLANQGDLASEKYLMETIHTLFPEDKIMSEETASSVTAEADEFLWVIDPVDGTTNYAKGRAYCAVSIGLIYQDQVVAGAAFNPITQELFTAEKGKGAFLNHQPIHCSQITEIKESLFVTDSYYTPEVIRDNISTLFKLTELSRVFSGGSAVMQMCEVAVGRFEAYLHTVHKAWDNAAAFVIAQEAGAVIVNRKGEPVTWKSPEVFIGNEVLIRKCVAIFNQTS